jgi:hypothetical protein
METGPRLPHAEDLRSGGPGRIAREVAGPCLEAIAGVASTGAADAIRRGDEIRGKGVVLISLEASQANTDLVSTPSARADRRRGTCSPSRGETALIAAGGGEPRTVSLRDRRSRPAPNPGGRTARSTPTGDLDPIERPLADLWRSRRSADAFGRRAAHAGSSVAAPLRCRRRRDRLTGSPTPSRVVE